MKENFPHDYLTESVVKVW